MCGLLVSAHSLPTHLRSSSHCSRPDCRGRPGLQLAAWLACVIPPCHVLTPLQAGWESRAGQGLQLRGRLEGAAQGGRSLCGPAPPAGPPPSRGFCSPVTLPDSLPDGPLSLLPSTCPGRFPSRPLGLRSCQQEGRWTEAQANWLCSPAQGPVWRRCTQWKHVGCLISGTCERRGHPTAGMGAH